MATTKKPVPGGSQERLPPFVLVELRQVQQQMLALKQELAELRMSQAAAPVVFTADQVVALIRAMGR